MDYVLPPWVLHGRGFILLYRFPGEFIRNSCLLPASWLNRHWSGFGYVILVDYHDSPVGPYRELLLIPGSANFGSYRRKTITKIYVDSPESMVNGRRNWGIPKELATFHWRHEGKYHYITVNTSEGSLDVVLQTGFIAFPITTRILPLRLLQELDQRQFEVNPSGSGMARLSFLKKITISGSIFPDIQNHHPIAGLYVQPFKMIFPPASIDIPYGN